MAAVGSHPDPAVDLADARGWVEALAPWFGDPETGAAWSLATLVPGGWQEGGAVEDAWHQVRDAVGRLEWVIRYAGFCGGGEKSAWFFHGLVAAYWLPEDHPWGDLVAEIMEEISALQPTNPAQGGWEEWNGGLERLSWWAGVEHGGGGGWPLHAVGGFFHAESPEHTYYAESTGCVGRIYTQSDFARLGSVREVCVGLAGVQDGIGAPKLPQDGLTYTPVEFPVRLAIGRAAAGAWIGEQWDYGQDIGEFETAAMNSDGVYRDTYIRGLQVPELGLTGGETGEEVGIQLRGPEDVFPEAMPLEWTDANGIDFQVGAVSSELYFDGAWMRVLAKAQFNGPGPVMPPPPEAQMRILCRSRAALAGNAESDSTAEGYVFAGNEQLVVPRESASDWMADGQVYGEVVDEEEGSIVGGAQMTFECPLGAGYSQPSDEYTGSPVEGVLVWDSIKRLDQGAYTFVTIRFDVQFYVHLAAAGAGTAGVGLCFLEIPEGVRFECNSNRMPYKAMRLDIPPGTIGRRSKKLDFAFGASDESLLLHEEGGHSAHAGITGITAFHPGVAAADYASVTAYVKLTQRVESSR